MMNYIFETICEYKKRGKGRGILFGLKPCPLGVGIILVAVI
jgi:hypothetical protein